MAVAAKTANQELRGRLATDVASIDNMNAWITASNRRVLPVLEANTGQALGGDRHAWESWWTDALGYAQSQSPTKPLLYEEIAARTPQIAPQLSVERGPNRYNRQHSCFGRGTPVLGHLGVQKIESFKIGDLVLSSDIDTGALSYQPVVAIHHNPPAATFKVDLGTDTIVATGIHRLWKAGKGWVMTRDLKPGDVLRTVGGTAVVKGVTPEKVQPVFNLEVAEGHDFFVGETGVLAHDNSLIRPVSDPFDARPELAAVDGK